MFQVAFPVHASDCLRKMGINFSNIKWAKRAYGERNKDSREGSSNLFERDFRLSFKDA